MDMILEDMKAKSELLQFDIDTLEKELSEIDISTFELNPRISEIARELTELKERKKKNDDDIIEYTKKNGG